MTPTPTPADSSTATAPLPRLRSLVRAVRVFGRRTRARRVLTTMQGAPCRAVAARPDLQVAISRDIGAPDV